MSTTAKKTNQVSQSSRSLFDPKVSILNRMSATLESIIHGFYRAGITNTLEVYDLFKHIANINPKKWMYVQIDNGFVEIITFVDNRSYGKFEHKCQELWSKLACLNTPVRFIVEERGGIESNMVRIRLKTIRKPEFVCFSNGKHTKDFKPNQFEQTALYDEIDMPVSEDSCFVYKRLNKSISVFGNKPFSPI